MADTYDLVVIGGGSGGFAAAMRAVQLGGKVAIVEGTLFGGNCMNKACIPSKFLMTVARLLGNVRKAGRFGVQVGEPSVDLAALHERKDLIIEGLRLGTEQHLASYGITLVAGRGKLVTPDTVEVNGQLLQARNVVIATGSAPAQVPLAGADLPGVIGTEEAIELREVPQRLAILGSQPWDLELAQYFRALGSAVTLIEPGERLLAEADHDVSQRLGKVLHDAGIEIKRRVTVEAIRQGPDSGLLVVLAEGKGEVVADKVLAARRLPNSTGLGLRELNAKMEGGSLLVNARMETSLPHVYAIGDVTAGPMWSHKANAEGIVAGQNAMGQASKMDDRILPRGLFTWPEVAWVGLTEEQATAQYGEVNIGQWPLAMNPYAMLLDDTAGVVKVIADKKYGKILGVHMVAPGAVDLINSVAVAMLAEASVGDLMRLIPLHPSSGEALVDAAMDAEKRSLHMPKW